MNLQIRPENDQDFHLVEDLTRNAFWDVYQPGCTEHLILHRLRQSPGFIPALDLVAEGEGAIAGHGIATRATVTDAQGTSHDVLCLGPLSVDPSRQGQGIGGSLIRALTDKARALGYRAIVLIGHPSYYGRFGFRCTEEWGITMPDGSCFPEMMLVELYPGALDGIRGTFHPDAAFDVSQEEADVFDLRFPHRDKHITDTQLK